MINGKYCCPKIYFNHRCFSGPYLNKGRIAELPQCVGPGNCVLVLREVRFWPAAQHKLGNFRQLPRLTGAMAVLTPGIV